MRLSDVERQELAAFFAKRLTPQLRPRGGAIAADPAGWFQLLSRDDARSLARRAAAVVPDDDNLQPIVAYFAGEACELEAVSDYVPTPVGTIGDPRKIRFWRIQYKLATRCEAPAPGKTKLPKFCQKHEAEYTKAELEAFLPIAYFGGEVTTVDETFRALKWKKGANQQFRADRQNLATLLNLASGELSEDAPIDLNGDGDIDGSYSELYSDAEDHYAAGEYRKAKRICRKMNLL